MAGSVIACRCGQQIQIPTLREITQLPDADAVETQTEAYTVRWTRRQGLFFAIGAALILVSMGIAAWLLYARPAETLAGTTGQIATLDDHLSALTPVETLKLWNYYQTAPGLMVTLPTQARAIQRKRQLYLTAAWIIGAVGIAMGMSCMVCSLRTPHTR